MPLKSPLLAVAAFAVLATSACTSLKPVAAWEKGLLAKPEMTFQDNPLAAKFEDHMNVSREAASGGAGVGGGGCGCN